MKQGPVKSLLEIFFTSGDGPDLLYDLNDRVDFATRQSVCWPLEVLAFQEYAVPEIRVPRSSP